jgi:hypothetical protein
VRRRARPRRRGPRTWRASDDVSARLARIFAARTRERTGTSAKVTIQCAGTTLRSRAGCRRRAAGRRPGRRDVEHRGEGVIAASPTVSATITTSTVRRRWRPAVQKPARVSTILPAPRRRDGRNRTGVDAGGVDGDRWAQGDGAHAGAPASSGRSGRCRAGRSRRCGQLEEEALEARVVGRRDSAQHDAADHGRASDGLGVGVDEPALAVGA